ncbi:MAG: low temperature-induced protein [Patescibacteria group bacterium]
MKTTTGIYSTHADAESAIKELRSFGIPDVDISYIYVDSKGAMKDGQSDEKVSSGMGSAATAGAIVGAIAGLVVANGILPGFGTLFVAGPLATALGLSGATATAVAGAATGLVAGGLIGGLVSLGINNTDAILYEALVRKGDILVIVRSDAVGTMDIFVKSNAKEVREYAAK